MDMFIRSTGLAQPVESFTQGARLRAALQQIDQEQQAQTFNQTMKVIDTVQRSREAKARIAMQQQEIDLRARESENRMRLQQESMNLRRASITARSSSATAGQPQFTPAGVYPGSSTPAETTVVEPNIPATPTPLEPPAASESVGTPTGDNFMAAAPAGDAEQISPLDMSGAGQPEGMPMLAIPKVDDVIDQNPMIAAPAKDAGSSDGIWGTLEKPGVTSSGRGYRTEYAVVNGVRSTRTVNEKTGTETKWTAAPSAKTAATGSPEQGDPLAGAYTNADGVLVKKIGDTEIPIDQMTLRSKGASVTLRQPKKVDSSRVALNPDGTGTYTDESGASIPVQAKGVTFANGKFSVRYDVPGAEPIETPPDEQARAQLESFDKLGIKLKSASFNSKGQIQLQGSVQADDKPKAGTLGALTEKWSAKAKQWRDERLDAISNPSMEEKAMVILGKPADKITQADYAAITAEQWSDAYYRVREGMADQIAKRIEALDGIPAAKVKEMIFGAIPEDESGGTSGDDFLPPKEATLLPVAPQAPAPAPAAISPPKPASTPTAKGSSSFLDRIIPKIQAKRAS